ncbi:MAG: alpha/beta hydrolase fold-3 domain protein [Burkholderiales bacterium]|nr:alpha/beta hydrolase fold-3 domain protein [Burkholderiales bacterium]
MTVHPQVKALLERVARSPLPPYHTVPAFVARRIYRDTRSALAPKAPEVSDVKLLVLENRIAVRVYRPSSDILPALVFFHGGGWTIGDLDTHDVLCRQLAAGARCAVFSVDYRLAPENPFPAAVDDAVAATKYLMSNPGPLKIDASRIAVGGDSAGGNLAAVVALELKKHNLAFQLLIYPATDQRCEFDSHSRNGEGYLLTKDAIGFFRGGYLPDAKDWTDWRASPLLAADHRGVAPAYVLTAGFDPLLDEGRAYARKLSAAGVAVEYREYADMVHGFMLFGGVVDTANAAVAECCARLRTAFEKVEA